MRLFSKSIYLITGMLALLASSCNEDTINPLREDYPEPGTTATTSRKVMWIIMDGANGASVNEARNTGSAPNLRTMTETSIYTFNGLADSKSSEAVTKERAWSNLMTGVTSHGVTDSESLASITAPSVIDLLKTKAAQKQVAVIGADKDFVESFDPKADSHFSGSDSECYYNVVEMLAQTSSPDFVILELSSVRKAGENDGFMDEEGLRPSSSVLDAIKSLDNYIGSLRKLVAQRSERYNEDWLIAITSSHGGVAEDSGETVYDKPDRKTFAMLYHPDFTPVLQQMPKADEVQYSYYIPTFHDGENNPYAEVRDASLFNINFNKDKLEENSDYTIQYFYMQKNRNWESQHTIISKAVRQNPARGEGWAVNNDYFRPKGVFYGMTIWAQSSGIKYNDTKWHVTTIRIKGDSCTMAVYVDGVLANNGGKPANLSQLMEDVDMPLRIGRFDTSSGRTGGDFYVTNVQFYNIALPVEYIQKNYGLVQLDERGEAFPYWDNLIGYWPLDREADFQKDVCPDYSKYGSVYGGENAGRSDMVIHRSPVWISGQVRDENVKPQPSDSYFQAVFNNVDFAYQTLQWLGIPTELDWNLEGISRSLPYKNLQ